MAFATAAITLVATTPTALLVQGGGANQFKSIAGTVQDPLPVMIVNTSATATFVGGPSVGASSFPLVQNVPMVMNLYGNPVDIPFAYSAGTPTINVIVGRQ